MRLACFLFVVLICGSVLRLEVFPHYQGVAVSVSRSYSGDTSPSDGPLQREFGASQTGEAELEAGLCFATTVQAFPDVFFGGALQGHQRD